MRSSIWSVAARSIPINVRLGGFYRAPTRPSSPALAEQLKSVQEFSRDLVRWTAKLDFPSLEHDYEFVALRHATEYPMNEGRLVSNRGLDIAMDQFAEQFEEYQVPYSNALQCRRKGGGAYFVGPLARWNLCADQAGDRNPATRPRDRDHLAMPQSLYQHRRPRPGNSVRGG